MSNQDTSNPTREQSRSSQQPVRSFEEVKAGDNPLSLTRSSGQQLPTLEDKPESELDPFESANRTVAGRRLSSAIENSSVSTLRT